MIVTAFMKQKKAAVLLLFATGLSLWLSHPAYCQSGRGGAKITNFGDGIVMYRYADRSGFVITVRGAKFHYDEKSKTMMYESGDGTAKTIKLPAARPKS